jgi:hypothetical protein
MLIIIARLSQRIDPHHLGIQHCYTEHIDFEFMTDLLFDIRPDSKSCKRARANALAFLAVSYEKKFLTLTLGACRLALVSGTFFPFLPGANVIKIYHSNFNPTF